ncbi:hypothetical protein [Ferrimonas kyonanensis]|uniref:hypothetical protein n=1 Tax=Ferrimonas kyonanensis TaxID=364763 RepID=UPI0003FEE3A6|nr:hypothetical protein [Ferrimonas kyonanensis]
MHQFAHRESAAAVPAISHAETWRYLKQGWRHWVPDQARTLAWGVEPELAECLAKLGYQVGYVVPHKPECADDSLIQWHVGSLSDVPNSADIELMVVKTAECTPSRSAGLFAEAKRLLRYSGVLVQICGRGGKESAGRNIVQGFKAGWSLRARYDAGSVEGAVTLVWQKL